MSRSLVIKLLVGADQLERLQTGLSVAAAACAADVDVSLWLAGDAAWLGVAPALSRLVIDDHTAELLAAVLPAATVAVCARCAQRRGISSGDLRLGVTIQGAAAFVAAITKPGVQALVY